MRASNRTTEVVPPTARLVQPGEAAASPAMPGPSEMVSGDDGRSGFEARPHGILDLARSHPIGEVVYRRRAQVGGRIRSVRVRPWGEVLTFEVVVADHTGAITAAFLGRRSIAGVKPGGALTVEGMVGERNGKLVILNPAYDLRVKDLD